MNLCDTGVLLYTVDSTIATGQGPMRVINGGGASTSGACGILADATFRPDPGKRVSYSDPATGVSFTVGGPCLAEVDGTYACYVEGRDLVLNLTPAAGEAQAEWIDTWSGSRAPAGKLRPAVHRLDRPKSFGEAPAVLVVRPVK